MKILSIIVYVIFAVCMIVAYANGMNDYYKEKSVQCAYYFNSSSVAIFNEFLYWREEGKCCRYALIDNKIEQQCENG